MDFFYEDSKRPILRMSSELTFPSHLQNELEIVYMFSGQTEVFVDGKGIILSGGDGLVVFPNQIHSYHDITPITVAFMTMAPGEFPGFQNTYKRLLPESNKIPAKKLEEIGFEATARAILKDAPLVSEVVRQGYRTVFAGKLLDCCEFVEKQSYDSTTVNKTLKYCSDNYKTPIDLDSVAKNLGLSKSYLSHLFSDSLKISFRDYINCLRINDAKLLLENSEMTATEISSEVGFTSIRTFNRVFLKQTEQTPREYKGLLTPVSAE